MVWPKAEKKLKISLDDARKLWGYYDGGFPMPGLAWKFQAWELPKDAPLPNNEDLPMAPVNEDFSEAFMALWLAHQAEEEAKPKSALPPVIIQSQGSGYTTAPKMTVGYRGDAPAKPAPLDSYPGTWPPPKQRFPGL